MLVIKDDPKNEDIVNFLVIVKANKEKFKELNRVDEKEELNGKSVEDSSDEDNYNTPTESSGDEMDYETFDSKADLLERMDEYQTPTYEAPKYVPTSLLTTTTNEENDVKTDSPKEEDSKKTKKTTKKISSKTEKNKVSTKVKNTKK